MASNSRYVSISGSGASNDPDIGTLRAFAQRSAYWTDEIAMLAGGAPVEETYRSLSRLEARHLVCRIVRIGQTSWRRTELGSLIVATLNAVEHPPADLQ